MADSDLKRTKKMRERIYSCVGVGDCKGERKGPYSRPISEATCPLCDHGPQFEAFYARGKFSIARALLDEKIKPSEGLAEALYQCTLCGACHEVCNNCENEDWAVPARKNIGDHVEIWEAMRADLVDAGVAPMPRHKEIMTTLAKDHNPYQQPHANRKLWIPKELAANVKQADTLFFVGCTGAYKLPDIPKNFLSIAVKAKIPILIADEEWCCGSVAFRTGNEKLGQELVQHNFETFKKLGIKTIVACCSGCYRTLKIDYPKWVKDWPFKVVSAVEMVDQWIQEGKLKIVKKLKGNITYHDPCHLGRHARIFDAPRNIIKAITTGELIEMRRIKAYSYCCGAGGGVKSGFPELALEIAQDRIKEAEETKAPQLATVCPFCLVNLQDAAKSLKSKIKIVDLLDLVNQTL